LTALGPPGIPGRSCY